MAGTTILKDSFRGYMGEATSALVLADKLAHMVTVGEIGATADEIDTTALDSAAKEFEPGFDDFGTITLELNLVEDEYTDFSGWRKAKTMLNFGFVADNKSGTAVLSVKGQGWIKKATITGVSVGGVLKVSVDLRVNGEITEDFVEPVA